MLMCFRHILLYKNKGITRNIIYKKTCFQYKGFEYHHYLTKLVFHIKQMAPAGYIKIGKSLIEAQHEVADQFRAVEYHRLTDNSSSLKGRFKLRCIFLYATSCQKRINYAKSSRSFQKVRQQEVTCYDRFVVLGVAGTQHVILTFTKTPEESKRLLSLGRILEPGMPVWLLSPKIAGVLKGTQNVLVVTGDPLVPCERQNSFRNPPSDVNTSSYVFFDFKATGFEICNATPKENVCKGRICDAQSESSNCGCLVAESKKHWALSISITCDQLNETVTGDDTVTMTSSNVTRLFVHPAALAKSLCSDDINVYDMETAVITMAEAINEDQGFRLIGWFKPASDEENNVTAGTFSYHICQLLPAGELTTQQRKLMYGAPEDSDDNQVGPSTTTNDRKRQARNYFDTRTSDDESPGEDLITNKRLRDEEANIPAPVRVCG